MKKFLYVALMAVAVFMASCNQGGSNYYKTHKLVVDDEAGTINGVKYDQTTEKCWKVTMTETYMGVSASDTEHMWGSEFTVVLGCETAMAAVAELGVGSATYSYSVEPSAKDYDACKALDNQNN